MARIRWKLILLLPAFLSLTGCDSKKIVDLNLKYIPTDRVPAHTTDEQSQEHIADAATAVGQSLQELSAVQMTIHPPQKLAKPFDAHAIGMDKMASLNWTGPVEPALQKIADATRYRLTVIGKKPTIPADRKSTRLNSSHSQIS